MELSTTSKLSSTSKNEDVQKLASLLKGVRTCMLTTLDHDGYPHSRPMTLQEAEFDGDLWFFISRSSVKVPEIKHDDHINVSAQGDHAFISTSGRAVLVDDRAKAKELWNPLYKAYFPGGLDDPDLTLLKLPVERAEYWESPGGMVTTLLGFVKTITTGDRGNMGEHAKLGPR